MVASHLSAPSDDVAWCEVTAFMLLAYKVCLANPYQANHISNATHARLTGLQNWHCPMHAVCGTLSKV